MLLACMLAASPPAWAQPEQPPAPATAQVHPEVVVRESRQPDPAAAVYTEARSSAHVSSEDLENFTRISAADVLKGVAGVQVGDTRNGGGLDVNIRGIQGQGRIAVTVDGAQQAIDVYRSYAGTQQRSYIDPDLLGGIVIDKGPSTAPGEAGGIGGSVRMRTLEAKDIITDGKSFGLRIKGDVWDNGVSPPPRSATWVPEPQLLAIPRTGSHSLFGSAAQSGSLAAAYADDRLEFVAAYARRGQGNYFAGKHGRDHYRSFHEVGIKVIKIVERETVAKAYLPGEEVMNTSSHTESAMLKATLRPATGHELELGYRRFDGKFGEIMPREISRQTYLNYGLLQYPLGSMKIDTWTSRYTFKPGNDWIDLRAGLWLTDARSDQMNLAYGPASQRYSIDRFWNRQKNRRIGGDLSNRTRFDTEIGRLVLDLGGGFQHEDMRPQSSVLTTQLDRQQGNVLRDARRSEFNLGGRLTWQPSDAWEVWASGRYSSYRTRDRNQPYTPLYETTPDRAGRPVRRIVGYEAGPVPQTLRDSGFSPSVGVSYHFEPDTLAYANYTQGLRLPSLAETSEGTYGILYSPDIRMKPERAGTLELGLSTRKKGLWKDDDTASFKLAWFDTSIKDFITRYYRWNNDWMWFTNADKFIARGLEFQSSYDNRRFFYDFSATYYLKAKTCDAAFAAELRTQRHPYAPDTPDCADGGFMGSYSTAQNPPKYSVNLTAGARFFDEALTLGGRIMHTDSPISQLDKPWHNGNSTWQVFYQPTTILDAFLKYRLRKDLMLSVSLHNITDRYYLDPLAQSHMPGPGRTLRVGMQIKF